MEYKPYNIGRTTYWCAVHRILFEEDQECPHCIKSNLQAQVTAQLGARWMLYVRASCLKRKLRNLLRGRPQPPRIDPKDKPNFTNPWCHSFSDEPTVTNPPTSCAKPKVTSNSSQQREKLRVGDYQRLEQTCVLESGTAKKEPAKSSLNESGDINVFKVYRLYKLNLYRSGKEKRVGA